MERHHISQTQGRIQNFGEGGGGGGVGGGGWLLANVFIIIVSFYLICM